MNNVFAIPRLAVGSLRRNSTVYIPYLLANSICVFVFYNLSSVQQNDLMNNLPHADYIIMLMLLGEILLGIILIPFLISINKFLIKQRKKELGLYCMLGLEKKHIAGMLAIEETLLYLISIIVGVGVATVFSKLIFMFLLKVIHVTAETKFSFSTVSFTATVVFFGLIAIFNLCSNLLQVSLANPSELFKASKRGEKDPKHLWLSTVIGIVTLGGGFTIALMSKMGSMIFTDFFFAVLLVIIGTDLLFKSVSITFLKACRKNKKFYYKSGNFVTVSGMLYRMKKNASGLANICIFCTMTIITLICTLSVFIGEEEAINFSCPYDCEVYFNADSFDSQSEFEKIISDTATEYNVLTEDYAEYSYRKFYSNPKGNDWSSEDNGNGYYTDIIMAMTLDDYNRTQNREVTLAPDEILFFTAGENYGYDTAVLDGETFKVKEQLQGISFYGKNARNLGESNVIMVFDNAETISRFSYYELDNVDNNGIYCYCFNVSGENAQPFVDRIIEKAKILDSYNSCTNKYEWSSESYSLIGGLLFLGVFFGLVFIICMVLIMYYKQISEGYEDKKNFEIMQKVGMTNKEVRKTISSQILTVFFMPLVMSVIYTGIAINIVSNLLSSIQIYNVGLILGCAGITVLAFAVIYAVSYIFTAKAYYRIVK